MAGYASFEAVAPWDFLKRKCVLGIAKEFTNLLFIKCGGNLRLAIKWRFERDTAAS